MDLTIVGVGDDTGDKMDNFWGLTSVNMFRRLVLNSNVGIKTPTFDFSSWTNEIVLN